MKAAAAKPSAPTSQTSQPATADAAPDNPTAVYLSILCGDTSTWPRDPEQYRRDAIRDKARYPLWGDVGSNITPCAFWKATGADPDIQVDNKAGALVVQNQWDPQTPLASGLGLHRALKGSRLVYVHGGEGHMVYSSSGNKCAYDAVNTYLSTGTLPTKNVICSATGTVR